MTEADIDKIASAVAKTRPKGLENIPGGIGGAALAIVLVGFFAEDYFGDFKTSNAQLQELTSNQKLTNQTLGQLQTSFSDLERKTEDRYTRTQATSDLSPITNQVQRHEKTLENQADYMSENDEEKREIRSEIEVLKTKLSLLTTEK